MQLRAEAAALANNTYASQFYDDIAQYLPNYVTTSERGSWKAHINLPQGATNPIAILSAPGYDYQDNVFDTTAYQYWAEVPDNGQVEISRVKAGDYRLTVYADNIFGDFVYENVTVKAGQETHIGDIKWTAESAGTELWRLGVPDKSAGEYKHGNTPDASHPLQPPEYRIYWGAYDFIDDFPNGVNFKIGSSSEVNDFNYVHWSVFGGSLTRPQVVASSTINNWTISFDVDDKDIKHTTLGTFTVQFAGVTTAAGNTDVYSSTAKYSNLPYVVAVNGHDLDPYIVP
jgi:rhamnogalacturonan endolyase